MIKSTILAATLSLILIGCGSDTRDEPPQGNLFLGYFVVDVCLEHLLTNVRTLGMYDNYYETTSPEYDFEEFWWWSKGYAVEYGTNPGDSYCRISEYRFEPI
jgi:hypothetical protein